MAIAHVEVGREARAEMDRLLERMSLVEEVERAGTEGRFDDVLALLSEYTPEDLAREPALGVPFAWAVYYVQRWDRDRLCRFLDAMAPFSERHHDRSLRVRQAFLRASLLFVRGELAEAEEAYREVVTRAASDRVGLVEFLAWGGLGIIAHLNGRLSESFVYYERCGSLLPEAYSVVARCAVYNNRAMLLSDLGRHEEAQESARKALGFIRPEHTNWCRIMITLALVTSAAGDQSRARAIVDLAAERIVNEDDRAEADRALGLISIRQGRLDEAEPLLERALEQARASGERLLVAEVLEAQGELADRRDDLERARRCYLASEAVYREIHSQSRAARVRALADVLG